MSARRQVEDVPAVHIGVHNPIGSNHLDRRARKRDGIGLVAHHADHADRLIAAICGGRFSGAVLRSNRNGRPYERGCE